jgi:peptide/nickel transport system substrate-binding protein
LLDEAGWSLGANGLRQKNGQDFVLSTYESLPQPQNKETLQLVAQQWARLGIKLNVLAGDRAAARWTRWTPTRPGAAGHGGPRRSGRDQEQLLPQQPQCAAAKGGVSQKVKSFEDGKLNRLFDAIAAETDANRRLR